MKKHFPSFIFLLAYSAVPLAAQSQQPATVHAQSSSTAQPPPVTTVLKKTVGLLRVQFLTEHGPAEADGTCFFIFYEDKRGGDNFGFGYLVTNRHMAQPGIEDGKHYQVLRTTLRLNSRNIAQSSEEGVLPIDGQRLHWFYPVDDSVDLAVFPLLPDHEKYDYVPIPTSFFATRQTVEEQHIAEGERILFAGYFYQFPGEKKFQPIVREGILAMMPDEKLDTTLKKPGQLYLGDLHVFGGNSGSPLFVNLGGFRNGSIFAGDKYEILGIVSGFYREDSNLKLTVATTVNGTLEQNSGIAMIVPVDELKALLDTPALQAARDAEIAAKNANK
jgi:hypothetical protein